MVEKSFKVREDLNEMVKSIKFNTAKTKFGVRTWCSVKLFNDVVIEFADKEKIYDLFQSYVNCGETDFIKSKELVEEAKREEDGSIESLYICVKYTLKDGSVYRLFPSTFTYNKAIDNYYNLYKKQNKVEIPKK